MSTSNHTKRKASDSVDTGSWKRQGVRVFDKTVRANLKPYNRLPRVYPPITDYKKVPVGWNSQDNDLDENDVEANIQRCIERIEDGIMPQWWEAKLKAYEAVGSQSEQMMAREPKGLSFDTVVRLQHLEVMRTTLEKDGDELGQIPNIDAILNAYREKKLTWIHGAVTYWSKGEKICDGPKPFDWKEFDSYNARHEGYRSFWVEGLNGPGPSPMMANFTPNHRAFTLDPKDSQHLHMVDFSLRVPPTGAAATSGNSPPPEDHGTWEFLDDTGSSIMVIYRDDLTTLEAKRGSPAALIGNFTGIGVFGSLTLPTYKIEVTIKDDRGQDMMSWVPIQVAVKAGSRVGSNYRISGPWMRHRFFVGSSPDNNGLLCVSKNKTGLNSLVAAFPEDRVPNPPPEIAPAGGIPPVPPLNFGMFVLPGSGGGGGDGDDDDHGDDSPGAPPTPAPGNPPGSLASPPAGFGPLEAGPGPTGFGPGPVRFASGPVGPRPSDTGRIRRRRGPTLSPMGSPQIGPLPGLAGDDGSEESLQIGAETPLLQEPPWYERHEKTTAEADSEFENTDTPVVVAPRRAQPISALIDPLRALSPVQGLLLPQPGGGQLFAAPSLPVVPSQRMEAYEARSPPRYAESSLASSPVGFPIPERAETAPAAYTMEREGVSAEETAEEAAKAATESANLFLADLEDLANVWPAEEAQVDTEASTNIEEYSDEEEEEDSGEEEGEEEREEGDGSGDTTIGDFSPEEPAEGEDQNPWSDIEMEI